MQTQLNNKKPLAAQLTAVAGITPTENSLIGGKGTNCVTKRGNTVNDS